MESSFYLPIEMLQPNAWAEVVDVYGETCWIARMQAMGLQAGKRVRMVRSGSPCVIEVDSSRLCVRAEGAGQILVQPFESER